MLVALSTVGQTGPGFVVTWAGGSAHPAVLVRLQAAMSITETRGSTLPTYKVRVAGSTDVPTGRPPTAIVGWSSSQPEVSWALQWAALNSDTVPSSMLVT